MEVISFTQAIQQSSSRDKRRLLLGNGFSIGLFPNIFNYKNLFNQAVTQKIFKDGSEDLIQLFKQHNTFDFEQIMNMLKNTVDILKFDSSQNNQKLIDKFEKNYDELKNVLIETIARNHPSTPAEVTDEQYTSCQMFIDNFPTIYTLNYDLLLYWVILHFKGKLTYTDGFRDPNSGVEPDEYLQEDYVSWKPGSFGNFNLYYLHGALHLYDAKYEIRKFCWSRTGISLKTQIMDALNKGMFPIFISEGDSRSKLEKFNHSAYFSKGLRSLEGKGGELFVFGLGFKNNDQHIMDAIVDSTISTMYVSIFDDTNSVSNKELFRNVDAMIAKRKKQIETTTKRTHLKVVYFDAKSANVWDKK